MRLQVKSREHRRNITDGLEAYGVSLATVRPMNGHPDLFVRKVSRSILGTGLNLRSKLKFDIVGVDNQFVLDPRKYHPSEKLTV